MCAFFVEENTCIKIANHYGIKGVLIRLQVSSLLEKINILIFKKSIENYSGIS